MPAIWEKAVTDGGSLFWCNREISRANWVENGRAGENPQPEGKEKQAGWVENGRTGENPQPEAKRSKQVG